MRRLLLLALVLAPLAGGFDLVEPGRAASAVPAASSIDAGARVPRRRAGPPAAAEVVRFAVIGDNGTGQRPEYEVGARMAAARADFPFTFVIMLGDNLYGSERPQDFEKKFVAPYKTLLDAGVEFYATLGNHDDTDQRYYAPFHMNGDRYYTFDKGPVAFFVLDSNYMEPKQLDWLGSKLAASRSPWKICYFHHPIYSSGGTHGSATDLRTLVEPLFIRDGVDVVFSGHEHFYERIKPQQGITYFISGAAGKLRPGDIRPSPLEAAGFSDDRSFMLVEVAGDVLSFRAISRTGKVVDSGTIRRREAQASPALAPALLVVATHRAALRP